MKINKLFDYEDFSDVEFIKAQEEFGEKTSFTRKAWEFVIMSYGLGKLGCFSNNNIALGLGCLKENLIYFYANRFKHVCATDVAYYVKGDKNFIPWGGESYELSEVYESNISYDRNKLTVLPMDMCRLGFSDETFDVVWSSSSVEHVGDLDDILTCFKEMQRVLKPNGILTITTEWNLSGGQAVRFANVQSFDFFVLSKIEEVAPNLKLVDPITLERSDNPKNKEKEYLLGKTNRFYGDVIDYTSMSLFWRKE